MRKRINLHVWPSKTVAANRFYDLKHDHDAVRGHEYWVVEFKKPGVRVVVRDNTGRLLLVRQYRHPIGRFTWEIPAGGVDGNETALSAAKRELHEECGLLAKSWVPMLSVVSMPNVTNFEASVFRASDLKPGKRRDASPANTEVSECRFFTDAELKDLIASGEMNDDKSLAALHLESVLGLRSSAEDSALPMDSSAAQRL